MTDLDQLWLLMSTALVLLMQGGFLLLEAGMTRAKNYINVAVKNLVDLGLAIVLFWFFGFGLMFGDSTFGLFGHSGFLPDLVTVEAAVATFFLFQVVFSGTTVTIISGAIAERASFVGYLGIVFTMAVVYPVYGHWVWGEGGWLAGLGFADFAGSTVVHSVGGWAALAGALVVGPRTGRFGPDGEPTPIRASNLPLAMTGTILLWFGWIGFNGGSVLAFDASVPAVVAVTMIGGAFGSLACLALVWWREGYPVPAAPLNGALAGLVAVTAGAHALPAWAAALTGAIGGLVALRAERELERRGVDDAVGAIPVHLGAGIWGTLAVGLFGRADALGTGNSYLVQVGVQVLGISVAALWGFGCCWVAFQIINARVSMRVTVDHEMQGLNVAEHREPTALIDLLHHMEHQSRTGEIAEPLEVESFTEVGQIAEQFNRLTAQLKSMSEVAEKIAVGNLRVEVLPRSDQDTFGLAFRQMVRDLRTTVREIASTASELQRSASSMGSLTDRIEGGVRAQMSDVAKGEQSFDEVQHLIDRLEDEVNALADATQTALQGLVSSMDRSKFAGDDRLASVGRAANVETDLKDVVRGIATSANEINSVVDVVRSIADTTNLLALNAHIEAVHAGGTVGAAFRVVAEEVRQLANETVASVAQIEGQVVGLQQHVNGAVHIVDQVTGEAAKISADFIELTVGVGTAAKELQGQAASARSAIQSINSVSGQNAATAAEFRELANQVQSSIESVGGQLDRFGT